MFDVGRSMFDVHLLFHVGLRGFASTAGTETGNFSKSYGNLQLMEHADRARGFASLRPPMP